VKVQPANVMDRDGIKPLLERVREHFLRLSYLWLDAGYNGKGKGKDWAEKALGLTAEVVRRPRRPRYVWVKEGEEIDWERIRKLLCPSLRFQSVAEEVGGGADVLVERAEQEDE
jgi:hypothetical protein